MAIATLRVEFRAALAAILTDFMAAYNPTVEEKDQLRQTYTARPASFHPPMAYVGPFNEPTITHQPGNRLSRPNLRGSLVLVQGLYDNEQSAGRLDVMADALITYLATQHSRVAGQLLEAISAEDVELVLKEVPYAATVVTIQVNAP